MILLAHPTGNTFFRATARALYSRNLLGELVTSICWDRNSPLSRILPSALLKQLERRSFEDIPISLQHSHPTREYLRLLASAFRLNSLLRNHWSPLSIDSLYNAFDAYVAKCLTRFPKVEAVYSYEDSAYSSFKVAYSLGIKRYYDLPIGYWRIAQSIFHEEMDLNPGWASTLTGLNDSPDKLRRKDEELSLASTVIVPSQFVRSTLQKADACIAPVHVVPFGSPPPSVFNVHKSVQGRLRVLYVGSLTQRKGLSYAIDAVKIMGDQVSFTIVGRRPVNDCIPLNLALSQYTWYETLPHNEILLLMHQHDVLILPSLFEGYALVISEALSQGLPVIATFNSGATESVRHGIEGFIVPIRDSHSIANCLQYLIDNPDELTRFKSSCLKRASELSWKCYENMILDIVA